MAGLTLSESAASPLEREAREARVPALRRITLLLDVAAVGIACVVFLAICLYQLDLPGLYNDEAFDVIPAMQIVLGHPVELLRGAYIDVLGTKLPLMSSSDYQGVTSTYLALPFFAIFGVNVFSLRLMTVLVGVTALVLAFFLARSWFGAATARLTVLLLAVSPAWVFWSRLGVYVVSEVVPIGAGALLAFTTWVRRRPVGERNAPLYVGMFLLGLGLTTKLLFLWFIAAVAICALLLWGGAVWEHKRDVWHQWGRWLRVGLLSLVAFCAGAFPFLLYNLQTRGTINLIRHTLSNPAQTTHGVDNTAFVRNLWTEADAFKVLLDGGYFWFQGFLRIYANPLTPTIFAISAVGLVAFVLAARGRGQMRFGGLLLWGAGLMALSFALSLVLTLGAIGISPLIVTAVVAGAVGTALVVLAAWRGAQRVAEASWVLLAAATSAGAVWWFGGVGRPEGKAPGAFLGLWPVDTAGILFWIAGFGLTLVLALDRRPVRHQRAVAAALAMTGLIVAQSTMTISGLWSTHLLVLLPLPQIIIAAFAVTLGSRAAGWLSAATSKRLVGAVRALPAVLLVGAIVVLDLGVDYAYHNDLSRTGGGSTFSDAIYSLSDYLDRSGKKVVAMDWGFRRPIQFLTQERVDPIEAYGLEAEASPRFYETLRELLKDPNTLYLFHVREGTAYPRLDAFFAEAKAQGKEVVLERTFYHRHGLPVYEVYSARTPGGVKIPSNPATTQAVLPRGTSIAAATRTPGPPPQYPIPTLEMGWVDGCVPRNTDEPQCTNGWRGIINGEVVKIIAGMEGSLGDPTQGLVMVYVSGQPLDIYDTPQKVGPVRIVAVNGTLVTLNAVDLQDLGTPRATQIPGRTFVFDIATRQWVSPAITPMAYPSRSSVPSPQASPSPSP